MVEATFGSFAALNCHTPYSNEAISTSSSNTKTLSSAAGKAGKRSAGRSQSWETVRISPVTIKKHFCQAENLRFIPIPPVRLCQSSQHAMSLIGPAESWPGSHMLRQLLRTSVPALMDQLRLKPQEGQEDLQVGPPRGRPPGRQAYGWEAT